MELNQLEIELIVKALKDAIVEGYSHDPEDGGMFFNSGPTIEDEARNKEIKALIKKLKPPLSREKKPELPWRNKPRTEKQTQVLEAFGIKTRGVKRGEASDIITGLIKKYDADDIQDAYKIYCKNKGFKFKDYYPEEIDEDMYLNGYSPFSD